MTDYRLLRGPDDGGAEGPASTALRALKGTAAAGAATLAAVSAHNAYRVLRLIAEADLHDHDLDHDGLIGSGVGAPVRLTVLGDSTATGFGLKDPDAAFPRLLAASLSGAVGRAVALQCLARRGARIQHVTTDQVPRIGDHDPHVVVVSAGANDALGRRLPFQVRNDTRRMIEALRAATPGAHLLIGATPDLGGAPALPAPLDEIVGAASRWVARAQVAAAEEEGVAFACLDFRHPADKYGPDGFHGGPDFHADAAAIVLGCLLREPPDELAR